MAHQEHLPYKKLFAMARADEVKRIPDISFSTPEHNPSCNACILQSNGRKLCRPKAKKRSSEDSAGSPRPKLRLCQLN